MKKKTVSVVIPCFNEKEYVGAAVQSAINQSYDRTEVIVVDDGSTDDSLDVVRQYEDEIQVISTANRGASHARDVGLQRASGTFVKFLDADDILRPHIVSKQVEESRYLDDDRGIVYSDIGRMDTDGSNRSPRSLRYRPRPNDTDPLEFLLTSDLNTQCPLHRREFLLEVGGFDEGFVREQDYDLHLKLGMAGVRFHFWGGIGGFLRQHDDPERIANKDHVLTDTDAVLGQLRKRHHRFAQYFGDEIPAPFREHVAQRAWNNGRRLLRAGRAEQAADFFTLSMNVAPQGPACSPLLYRLLVQIIGPMRAESLLLRIRG